MRVNKKDKKRWKTETLLLLNALKFATYIRKMLFSGLLHPVSSPYPPPPPGPPHLYCNFECSSPFVQF